MTFKLIPMIMVLLLLGACDADDGSKGAIGVQGTQGDTGLQGLEGINCWDINGDRINDEGEDKNNDGEWDAKDCIVVVSPPTQSSEVEFNHQHICEALANLGQYPQGCPSNTHTVPTGTLTKINQAQLFDDGNNNFKTCNNEPSNGLLSMESRVDTNDPNKEVSWWVLEGGYIANTVKMPYSDAVAGACKNLCAGDSNCIASLALEDGSSADCSIFYHSDTIEKYERICALAAPSLGYTANELCALSLRGQQLWDSMCP